MKIVSSSLIVLATLGFFAAAPAEARVPIFSARCPTSILVDGDRTGTVRINGLRARVREFSPTYFEARHGNAS